MRCLKTGPQYTSITDCLAKVRLIERSLNCLHQDLEAHFAGAHGRRIGDAHKPGRKVWASDCFSGSRRAEDRPT
jgi:hypothetical protein